jgi:hypothetical protein
VILSLGAVEKVKLYKARLRGARSFVTWKCRSRHVSLLPLWTLDSAIVTYLKRLRDRKISIIAMFHHRTPEAELDLPIGGQRFKLEMTPNTGSIAKDIVRRNGASAGFGGGRGTGIEPSPRRPE